MVYARFTTRDRTGGSSNLVIDDSEDERLLGALASALVAIDELRSLTTFQMPYPPTIQRTLDLMVLHCLRQRAHAPTSVPGLVRWAYERPLETWPLALPEDVYPGDEFLVDSESGTPTTLCHEIALCAETDNPLREASRQMATVIGIATERDRPSAYSAMRGLLATHPVLTNERLNDLRFTADLGPLDKHLGDQYDQIGLEYVVGNAVHPCGRCGTPLLPTADGPGWCERDECRLEDVVPPGDRLDWDERVLMLIPRRYRQFVFGPGRIVLRIADRLELPPGNVTRWPLHNPGDLRIAVSGGQAWTATVVDWHNPALLGKAIAVAIDRYGTDKVFWIVAQYRVDANPDYLRITREHATGTARVYSEEEFVEMVRRHGEESGHA